MRFLLVGLGSIGQRHARNLRTLLGSQAELLAYRARGLDRALTDALEQEPDGGVERKLGVRSFSSLREALALRPDAVFVCNPNSLHVPTALEAARAGCHLFIEKPLSHGLDGVEELAREVQKRRLVALVGYQMRFHPCVRLLKERLDAGLVGRPVAARLELGENMADWHRYEDYRETYAAKREYGGGVILCQIHELDLAFHLFGPAASVRAAGGHLSRLELEVEDVASILLECGPEERRFPVHVHLDCVQRPPSRTCQVIGDAGKMSADLRSPSFERWDREGRQAESLGFEGFERNRLFLDELRHFLACLRGEEKPGATLADGAQSLRAALEARRCLERARVGEPA